MFGDASLPARGRSAVFFSPHVLVVEQFTVELGDGWSVALMII